MILQVYEGTAGYRAVKQVYTLIWKAWWNDGEGDYPAPTEFDYQQRLLEQCGLVCQTLRPERDLLGKPYYTIEIVDEAKWAWFLLQTT